MFISEAQLCGSKTHSLNHLNRRRSGCLFSAPSKLLGLCARVCGVGYNHLVCWKVSDNTTSCWTADVWRTIIAGCTGLWTSFNTCLLLLHSQWFAKFLLSNATPKSPYIVDHSIFERSYKFGSFTISMPEMMKTG
jgi:hypothetical protein